MKSIPQMKNVFILFLIITFFLGIYFCMSIDSIRIENMTNQDKETPHLEEKNDTTCPNVLIRQGNILLLYNTLQPENEKNPLRFSNLDDYIQYTRTQRDTGVRCPILYLQQETNTQGNDIYRIRPSPFSIEGGLPPKILNPVKTKDASLQNPPYNQGGYPAFDPYNQYNGLYTDLDQVHDSTRQVPISDNPMDPNWGGVIHSQQMVDSGKYDKHTVGKPVMVPRTLALQP
jgi:hypothetical protein